MRKAMFPTKKLDWEIRRFKTRVQDLELSARTLNALETAGIRTLGGLAKRRSLI